MRIRRIELLSICICLFFIDNLFACFIDPGQIRNLQAVSGHLPDIPSSENQVHFIWDPPSSGGEPEGYYAVINTSSDYELTIDNTYSLELLENVREFISPEYSGFDDKHFYFHIAAACFDYDTFEMRIGPTMTYGAIRIDTVAPLYPSIIAPEKTATQSIKIQAAATNASYMYISNYGYSFGGVWEPFSQSRIWDLSNGEGLKTIYAQFKDDAGNICNASTIVEYIPYPDMPLISDQNIMHHTAKSIAFSITAFSDLDLSLFVETSNPDILAKENIFFTATGAQESIDGYSLTALAGIPIQCTMTFSPQLPGDSLVSLKLMASNDTTITQSFWINVHTISAPEGLNTANIDPENGVLLSWNYHLDAEYFKVYRSVVNMFERSEEISPWINAYAFTDSTAIPGQQYYYWLTTASDETGSNESAISTPVTGYRMLQPPQLIYSSDHIFFDQIQFYWNDCIGATHYNVFRSETSLIEDATKLTDSPIAQTSYIDTSVTPNTIFTYWIQATNDKNESIVSSFSEAITASTGNNSSIANHRVFTVPENPFMLTGTTNVLKIFYNHPESDSLTDVTVMLHFNNNHIEFSDVESLTHITITEYPDDTLCDDGDPSTNQMIQIHWNKDQLPAMCELKYTVNNALPVNTTTIHFSARSSLSVTPVYAGSTIGRVTPFSFDIDGNGYADALTDGLIMIRYMFELIAEGYTIPVAVSAPRYEANEILTYLETNQAIMDIDANGEVDALTDGLLILRYLFNFTSGDSLIENAVDFNATRTSDEDIAAYLKHLALD